jgi:hypothetical protein
VLSQMLVTVVRHGRNAVRDDSDLLTQHSE